MRYRSNPVEIDAVEWTGDPSDIPTEWIASKRFTFGVNGDVIIGTLEGPARATSGDYYIVRGTVGEFYPVRRDVFENKYTAVEP